MSDALPIRIGLLVVHGVGEQDRGEFVDGLADDLRKAITAQFPEAQVATPRIIDPVAPVLGVTISGVPSADGAQRDLELCLHEAYWADLDDRSTFWDRAKFWWWGFSMWARNGLRVPLLPGTRAHMKLDYRPANQIRWVRVKLFAAANLFCALALVLRLATQAIFMLPLVGPLLKRGASSLFRCEGPIETIVAYVGDVKLYQAGEPATEPVERRDGKPRVAIRRRVIREMVRVATAGYERWYVTAHSLGSIIAFNALMETREALPNYLDPETCRQLRTTGWLTDVPGSEPSAMDPPRPRHVKRDECLDRSVLFGGLRGFFTYGSPIDKFTVLWPHVAPVNDEPAVFRPEFEWVNVYDQVDPVAGFLDLVGDLSRTRKPVASGTTFLQNWGYARERTIATGHTHYFARPEEPASIARAVAKWLIEPATPFPAAQSGPLVGSDRAEPAKRTLWFQFVLIYLALLMAGGALYLALFLGATRLDEAAVALVVGNFDWSSVFDGNFRKAFWTLLPWAVPAFAGGCCAIVAATGGIHWLVRSLSQPALARSDDHRVMMAPGE